MKQLLSNMLLVCLLLTASVALAGGNECKSDAECNRSKIPGLWKYGGAYSFLLYKKDNTASEAMSEIQVTIDYAVIWKEGCNHELVVKEVKSSPETPPSVLEYLYKKGDRIQVEVHSVNEKIYKYTMTYKGKDFGCTEVYRMAGVNEK